MSSDRKLDWQYIKEILKSRRFARKMEAQGYRRHETDWEIVRGSRQNEKIVDVVIDVNGKSVWTKIGDQHR